MAERTKETDLSKEPPEREDDREETRQLIRNAGAEGLTLLKNEGDLLPIRPSEIRVAVIGHNVNRAISGGGGAQASIYTIILLRLIASRRFLGEKSCIPWLSHL